MCRDALIGRLGNVHVVRSTSPFGPPTSYSSRCSTAAASAGNVSSGNLRHRLVLGVRLPPVLVPSNLSCSGSSRPSSSANSSSGASFCCVPIHSRSCRTNSRVTRTTMFTLSPSHQDADQHVLPVLLHPAGDPLCPSVASPVKDMVRRFSCTETSSPEKHHIVLPPLFWGNRPNRQSGSEGSSDRPGPARSQRRKRGSPETQLAVLQLLERFRCDRRVQCDERVIVFGFLRFIQRRDLGLPGGGIRTEIIVASSAPAKPPDRIERGSCTRRKQHAPR